MNVKTAGLTTLFISLLWSISCIGQVYVNGVAIDTVETPFIQLIGSNSGDLNRTSIIIDYGQGSVSTAFSRQKISGPDKQPISFRSTIDALNFVVKQGWELVLFESASPNLYVYILQRKKRATE